MYVTSVIPITKSRATSELSYFSPTAPRPGSLIKVPLRNSEIPALVIGVEKAKDAKSQLKSAGYALKKISKIDTLDMGLGDAFINAARRTAEYHATSMGSVLRSLLPKLLLETSELIGLPINTSDALSEEPMVIQLERQERMGLYRSIVRESFAKKKSLILVVPTHEDGLRIIEEVSHGISARVHFFSLSNTKGEQRKAWRGAKQSALPVLFITTPAGLAFDREDLGTIILERENSRAYRSMNTPFLKTKIFVENLAKETRRRLILGDSVLSLEALERTKAGRYVESHVKWRHTPSSTARLVDMKISTPDVPKAGFEIISNELKNLIEKALSETGSIFLFGARKGLSPSTICGDCGAVLSCTNCAAPVVLHEKNGERRYICHACGMERNALTLCDTCGSWKLEPLGIGTDRIYKEVKKLFPKVPIHLLDKDKAPTDLKARGIARDFINKGGILVGTELAFSYIERVPYVGVVSLDALFSIPDFSINERVFYLVSHLREMAKYETLIQTRNIGEKILTSAVTGNTLEFYTNEIQDREALSYPPFSIFIKISGKKAPLIKERFHKWDPQLVRDHLVMRLPRDSWPDKTLLRELSLLTPDFLIKVDPESIL